ncbi:hypothetical protein BAUCODRAFT_31860 [Baudoinia panamericana UAMH 10762]|uniref:ubiquitinyl hydrolase 1 n=1 Tax=Baudoinia panamericana (strain UAMH 10762) TaxID=717646 RepID=M2MMD4_BAUPA|nr:uncharacterized protein BAUCODRAFT_31860 [Baudoinia panamericana UAMH 10762]EMC97856.1 hypothetical protein BAUCODRAFT_31860 [Baudoinia panamericana UAMH 10762]
MDGRVRLESLQLTETRPSATTYIVYLLLATYAFHQLLVYLDYPILGPQELLWNAIVFLAPSRLVLDPAKRQELQANNMLSQTHAAKSEALRRILGMGTGALTHKLSGGEGIMRSLTTTVASATGMETTDAPPGLGNWDNSCYQNSVLQGLASLNSLPEYLGRSAQAEKDADSTSGSLLATVRKLNDASNNGKQLWTPAKLKSMSSWQQQDAQEYFSKIMDELDKDAGKKASTEKAKPGLEMILDDAEKQHDKYHSQDGSAVSNKTLMKNPVEGLLAQRVVCTRCRFSEGLSMTPFNCLTVPLGSNTSYDLQDCLDEYIKLEEISDVDCAKCTLLRAQAQLKQMLPPPATDQLEDDTHDQPDNNTISLPPELRTLAAQRLQAIHDALEKDDFSDKTLNETCQIPKRAHVSSTKTRQAVIGRAPQSLVVHVNRSVFDELTGMQRKNHAAVRYPLILDLGQWVLGNLSDGDARQALQDLRSLQTLSLADGAGEEGRYVYRLKAVVTHYGRHENGHYICYRRHPLRQQQDDDEIADPDPISSQAQKERWWRLSDEDVSAVTEEDVLDQGGVFMLFYERDGDALSPPPLLTPEVAEASDVRAGPEKVVREEDAVLASVAIKRDVTEPSILANDTTASVAPTQLGDADRTPQPSPLRAGNAPLSKQTTTKEESATRQAETVLESPVPSADEAPLTGTTTEDDESEAGDKVTSVDILPVLTPPPMMRTARGRPQESVGEGGFGSTLRAVAAT